jgi:hypothetical protein
MAEAAYTRHPSVVKFINAFCSGSQDTLTVSATSSLSPHQSAIATEFDVIARVFKHRAATGPVLSEKLNINVDKESGDCKPYVFFTRGNGIQMLLRHGQSNRLQAMLELGITRHSIDEALSRGFAYSLVVVPAEHSHTASWDSMLQIFAEKFPTVATYCTEYADQCKRDTKFFECDEFVRKYHSIAAVEALDFDHTLNPRRFLAETERSFIDFRVMMWLCGSANHLFTGAGYTIDAESGARGVDECILPNIALGEVLRHCGGAVVPVPVQLALS